MREKIVFLLLLLYSVHLHHAEHDSGDARCDLRNLDIATAKYESRYLFGLTTFCAFFYINIEDFRQAFISETLSEVMNRTYWAGRRHNFKARNSSLCSPFDFFISFPDSEVWPRFEVFNLVTGGGISIAPKENQDFYIEDIEFSDDFQSQIPFGNFFGERIIVGRRNNTYEEHFSAYIINLESQSLECFLLGSNQSFLPLQMDLVLGRRAMHLRRITHLGITQQNDISGYILAVAAPLIPFCIVSTIVSFIFGQHVLLEARRIRAKTKRIQMFIASCIDKIDSPYSLSRLDSTQEESKRSTRLKSDIVDETVNSIHGGRSEPISTAKTITITKSTRENESLQGNVTDSQRQNSLFLDTLSTHPTTASADGVVQSKTGSTGDFTSQSTNHTQSEFE